MGSRQSLPIKISPQPWGPPSSRRGSLPGVVTISCTLHEGVAYSILQEDLKKNEMETLAFFYVEKLLENGLVRAIRHDPGMTVVDGVEKPSETFPKGKKKYPCLIQRIPRHIGGISALSCRTALLLHGFFVDAIFLLCKFRRVDWEKKWHVWRQSLSQ